MKLKEILAANPTKEWDMQSVRASIDEGFDEEMRDAIAHARDSCADAKDAMMPKVLFTYIDKMTPVMAYIAVAGMPDPGERYAYFRAMGEQTARTTGGKSPAYLFLLSEMHFVHEKPGFDRSKLPKFLKDAPGAQECLMVAGLSVSGKKKVWRIGISRDAEGKVAFGEEDVMEGGDPHLLQQFLLGYAAGMVAEGRLPV